MPRYRTLKPDFWTDEKLSLLDPLTRLVFLGLISIADDAGRLIDNVKLIDGQLFPNTDESSRESLETLARLSRIVRYRVESGQQIIQIVNWQKHQRVEHPSSRVLPGPENAVLVQPRVAAKVTPTAEESSGESHETRVRASRLEEGRGKREEGTTSRRGGVEGTRPAFALGKYIDVHREFYPDSDPPAGQWGKVFKKLETKHGPDEPLRRWRICLAMKGDFATPHELSTHWSKYGVELASTPAAPSRPRVLAATEMVFT
jgi:hypothetical protein